MSAGGVELCNVRCETLYEIDPLSGWEKHEKRSTGI